MSRRTPRRNRGRPTALNPGVEKRLLDAVRGGTPLVHAATYAGVHPSTFHRWMVAGEEAADLAAEGVRLDKRQRTYRDFRDRVIDARAQVAVRNVALVQKAAAGGYVRKERRYRDESGQLVTEKEYADVDWRAAKWLLETSFSREFSAQAMTLEVSGPGGSPVQVQQVGQISALAQRLHEVAAARQADLELEAAGDDGVMDADVVEDEPGAP